MFGGQSAPLGAVVMPPQDRSHRAPQVARRNLGIGLHRLDQGLEHMPLRVRQHPDHPARSQDEP